MASQLRPEEIANYKKQFTVDELDLMARDQLYSTDFLKKKGKNIFKS
jgi:hypothetical protein